MATGEKVDPKERDRAHLLEEIRRRAEAAELARIEAEEKKIAESESADVFPNSPHDNPPASDAATPFLELLHLQSRKPDGPPPVKPDRHEDERAQKRIADLLHSAHDHYQNEKYEQSIADLEHLLGLAPGHGDASVLLTDVRKAKEIADALIVEEKRLKEEEGKSSPHAIVPPVVPATERLPAPEPDVLFSYESPHQPERGQSEPTQKGPVPRKKRHYLRWVSLVAACVAAIAAGILVYQNPITNVLQKQERVAVIVHAGEDIPEYVSAGVLEHFVAGLAARRHVKVIGIRSSEAVKGTSPAQAAATLRVPFVADLRLNRNGTGYQASIEVLDSRKNGVVAAASASLGLAELLEIDGVLQHKIASVIGLDQSGQRSTSYFSGRSEEVLEMYLLGRHLLRSEKGVDADSAIRVLMRCRERAENFAPLEAALGWANLIAFEQRGRKPAYLEEAHRRLQRSFSHGLKNAETYGLWGAIEYSRDNFKGAVERFQQARDLAPGDPALRHRSAMAFLRSGRVEEALKESNAATDLDPLNPRNRLQRALLLMAARDYAGAVAEFDIAFSLDKSTMNEMVNPYTTALVAMNKHERALDILKAYVGDRPSDYAGHYNLGRLYQLAGKPRVDWMDEFRITLDLIDDLTSRRTLTPQALMYKGLVQTRLGLFEEGVATGNKARSLAPNDVTLLYASARLFALQKNRSGDAIAHLGTAVGTEYHLPLLLDLDFAPIRNDPRFSAIIGG